MRLLAICLYLLACPFFLLAPFFADWGFERGGAVPFSLYRKRLYAACLLPFGRQGLLLLRAGTLCFPAMWLMILDSLRNAERVSELFPALRPLFSFVSSHDLSALRPGRIELDGERLFVNVDDSELLSASERKLEVHRRYVDVHIPVSGPETVGWRPLSSLPAEGDAPFDAGRDFMFYSLPASVYFTVRPGDFYVMCPEDAHAPVIGEGRMRKLVGKLLVEDFG